MRILEFIPVFIDGGAERFVVDIASEFSNEGHKVHISSLFAQDAEGMKYFSEWDGRIERSFLDKQLGMDLRILWRLARLIRDFQPDIIHTHLRVVNYIALVQLFSWKKVPVVHTVHNHAPAEVIGSKEKTIREWLLKFKRIHPVTISQVSDESFSAFYPGMKAKRIDNGRSFPKKTDSFDEVADWFEQMRGAFGSDVKVWVNIGRLTPQKNQVVLVQAFTEFLRSGHNGLLVILGTERPPWSDPIMEGIKPYLGDRILWLGGKSNATDYVHLAHFFILSSLYEGMPISLIEAMATGCLPVCTNVGGIPEMIDPHGVMISGTEVDGVLEGMKAASALSEEEKKERTEELRARYEERYSLRRSAEAYLDYFNTLL